VTATAEASPGRDLLITAIETNDRHGVGVLLQRLFPDTSAFVNLRTISLYDGYATIEGSHHELYSRTLTVAETEEHLGRILRLYRIRRILCVPYYREEFVHAVLAKKLTGAPLCTYLMDDQNLFAHEVPDHWVARLLEISDLRLGISPELCLAYGRKFGHSLHLLPPVVERWVPLVPCYWEGETEEPMRAAMLGNIWTHATFLRLRALLRATRLQIDWYGNGPKASWLKGTPEEWEADGLRCMGHLPEADLVAALASYPFITVPSGTLADDDDNPSFSRLSLPSRLLFCHARTDTPALVLGSAETPAGRFVRRLGSGLCASYDLASLRQAMARLADPDARSAMRSAIRGAARQLALPRGGEWIWASLQSGKPPSAPFQSVFPPDTAPPPWLENLKPVVLASDPALPDPGEPFGDETLPAFAVLRKAHHALLRAEGFKLPGIADLELAAFAGAMATYLLHRLSPRTIDVLFLGQRLPPELRERCPQARIWQIADLATWQREGYAGDPRLLTGDEPYPHAFPQFDAIMSSGWLGELPDDRHALEGLSLYLDACARPGALHLHYIAAVRHPSHFWQPPALAYLRQRFTPVAVAPSLDAILCTDEAFSPSEAVYDRTWRQTTGRPLSEFGFPIGLLLSWRKGAPAP